MTNDNRIEPSGINTADLLAADTSMGAVTLRVANLDLMTNYYRDAVALTLLAQGEGRSVLGRSGSSIVILEHAPALKHAGPREAGLRRACSPERGRRGNRPRVLRQQTGFRDHRAGRFVGAVRQRRRVSPPHGDELLEQRRRGEAPPGVGPRPGPHRGPHRRRSAFARRPAASLRAGRPK